MNTIKDVNDIIGNAVSEHDAKDDQIAALGEQLATEKDKRREERVAWVAAVVAIGNVILLGNMSNLIAPVAVLILELIAFLIFAKMMGIEYVAEHIDKLIGSVGKRLEKD